MVLKVIINSELIQKLDAHSDANEEVLIQGLEISRSTIRSVNTSAILDDPILDDPILDDNTPELQPTTKFSAKSMQNIKNFGNLLLDYIPPNLEVVDKALESFNNVIK